MLARISAATKPVLRQLDSKILLHILKAAIASIMLSGALLTQEKAQCANTETKAAQLHGYIEPGRSYSKIQGQIIRGAVVVKKGSSFPVALVQAIDSSNLKSGDKVQALLLEPIELAGLKIIDRGAVLNGWVSTFHKRRSAMHSRLTASNWLNSSALVGMHFNQIFDGSRHFDIAAQPSPGSKITGNTDRLPQGFDKNGRLLVEFHGAKYILASAAISTIALLSGPGGLIIAPAISGALGAAVPEYALDRPFESKTAKLRSRAAAEGMLKGLPGGFLATGLINKGPEVKLVSGEILLLELKNDLVINADLHLSAH